MDQISISDEFIISQIYFVRGEKVMLDFDLAALYHVETKQLKRQVRRNLERFPEDFMFELREDEYKLLRSQIGTLKRGEHSKYLPMAFTENGVAMLSSVLTSQEAVHVNIHIVRIFTKVRRSLLENSELKAEVEKIKTHLRNHDKNIELVFKYLDEFFEEKQKTPNRKRLGYLPEN